MDGCFVSVSEFLYAHVYIWSTSIVVKIIARSFVCGSIYGIYCLLLWTFITRVVSRYEREVKIPCLREICGISL